MKKAWSRFDIATKAFVAVIALYLMIYIVVDIVEIVLLRIAEM